MLIKKIKRLKSSMRSTVIRATINTQMKKKTMPTSICTKSITNTHTMIISMTISMPIMTIITATIIMPTKVNPNKIKTMQCLKKSIKISSIENANILSKQRQR